MDSSSELCKFQTEFWIPAPIEKIWDFYTDPQNISKLMGEAFELSVEPNEKIEKLGQVFDVNLTKVKNFNFKAHLKIEVVDYQNQELKKMFSDEIIQGPFDYWKHTHSFEAGDKEFQGGKKIIAMEAGTWVKDEISYKLPFSFIGQIANKLFVAKELAKTFEERKVKLFELFV